MTVTLNGAKVEAVGSRPVDTTTEQSLALVAANNKGEVSKFVGVLPVRPPEIAGFTVEPAGPVCSGCPVTLRWRTLRADKADLDGTTVPADQLSTGSATRNPTQSTEYLLAADNAVGHVEASVAITVDPNLPTPMPSSLTPAAP
jgi:hypothetical protein